MAKEWSKLEGNGKASRLLLNTWSFLFSPHQQAGPCPEHGGSLLSLQEPDQSTPAAQPAARFRSWANQSAFTEGMSFILYCLALHFKKPSLAMCRHCYWNRHQMRAVHHVSSSSCLCGRVSGAARALLKTGGSQGTAGCNQLVSRANAELTLKALA